MLAAFFTVLVVLFSNSTIRCGASPLSLQLAIDVLADFLCAVRFGSSPLSLPLTIHASHLTLFLPAIWIGPDKVAMVLTIFLLAFNDSSKVVDGSTSAVHVSILEPALVETKLTDVEAFAVSGLSASEDLADVIAFVAFNIEAWVDEPLEVFRLDELRSLSVIKVALFVSSLSYFLLVLCMD